MYYYIVKYSLVWPKIYIFSNFQCVCVCVAKTWLPLISFKISKICVQCNIRNKILVRFFRFFLFWKDTQIIKIEQFSFSRKTHRRVQTILGVLNQQIELFRECIIFLHTLSWWTNIRRDRLYALVMDGM